MPGLGNGKVSKFHSAVSGEHRSYHRRVHIRVTLVKIDSCNAGHETAALRRNNGDRKKRVKRLGRYGGVLSHGLWTTGL